MLASVWDGIIVLAWENKSSLFTSKLRVTVKICYALTRPLCYCVGVCEQSMEESISGHFT